MICYNLEQVANSLADLEHVALYFDNLVDKNGTLSPGGVLSPKLYVDVPAGPRKSDHLYTNFLPNFPPISIPFSKEKHPTILIKLGAFYNNLPKIHPIYVIWALSSLMKPPNRYTKFREKVPQKAGTYTYTMSMWEPPPGIVNDFAWDIFSPLWIHVRVQVDA